MVRHDGRSMDVRHRSRDVPSFPQRGAFVLERGVCSAVMSRAALLLLVACGSATPAATPVESRPSDWWIVRPVIDAGMADSSSTLAAIEAAPEDATAAEPANASTGSDTSLPGMSVRDALEKEGSTIDGRSPTNPSDDVVVLDGIRYEHGVPILEAVAPMWCGTRQGRICFGKQAQCIRAAKTCERKSAYACFEYDLRVEGKHERLCTASYSICEAARDLVDENDDAIEVTQCAIYRPKK